MEGIVRWLLTANGVSVSGVLLATLAVVLFGLHKRWMVPGWMYDSACKERDEARAALQLRHDEDKAESVKLHEHAEQMERQVEELKMALLKRQERRARQRSP